MSALLEYSPLGEDTSEADDGWTQVRRERPVAELIAARRARLREVAKGMTDQKRAGDLSEMVREHAEFAHLRQRANGEILD